MREVLFRGKRTFNNDWIEGGYCCCDNKSYIVISIRYIPDTRDWDEADYYEENPVYKPVFIEVVPKTVGQYTGLTDKNGTRIFEDDIVDILTENEEIGVIAYDEGGFVVNADGFCVDFHANINGTDLEVIGNIYDNPELLGVQR